MKHRSPSEQVLSAGQDLDLQHDAELPVKVTPGRRDLLGTRLFRSGAAGNVGGPGCVEMFCRCCRTRANLGSTRPPLRLMPQASLVLAKMFAENCGCCTRLVNKCASNSIEIARLAVRAGGLIFLNLVAGVRAE